MVLNRTVAVHGQEKHTLISTPSSRTESFTPTQSSEQLQERPSLDANGNGVFPVLSSTSRGNTAYDHN